MKKKKLSTLLYADFPVNLTEMMKRPYLSDDGPILEPIPSGGLNIFSSYSVYYELRKYRLFFIHCIDVSEPDDPIDCLLIKEFNGAEILFDRRGVFRLGQPVFTPDKIFLTISDDQNGDITGFIMTSYIQDEVRVIVYPIG